MGSRIPSHRRRRKPRSSFSPVAGTYEATRYLDDLPLAVMGFSKGGRVSYANAKIADLFATVPSDLVGKEFGDLGLLRASDYHQMNRFSRWVGHRTLPDAPSAIHYVRFSHRGRVKDDVVAVRLASVRSAGPIQYIATMWKPSRMTSVEEELGNILNYAGDPIIAVGSDGRIEFFNRAAERAFGYPSAEINGEPFLHLLAGDDISRENASAIWLGSRDHKESGTGSEPFLLQCTTREGLTFVAECVVSHTDFIGKGLNTVILRDVSDRLTDLEEARRQIGLDQVVLENMDEGIIVFDKRSELIAFNARFAEIFGIPPGTLHLGQSWEDVIRRMSRLGIYGAGDPETHIEERRRVKRNEASFAEDQIVLPDGRVLAARRRELPDGGFVATYRDVTQARASEIALRDAWQRLEANEARLRAIVDSSGDAILTLSGDGLITSANHSAVSCFGWKLGHLVSRPIVDLLPNFPFFQRGASYRGRVPALYRGEMLGLHRDGRRFPVEAVLYAVNEAEGSFYGLNIRDMSEQRSMQEQLAQASKLSVLGEMAAGMAHELNQPLSVMRMAADNALIRMEKGRADPEYLTEALELISSQAAKMGSNILNLKIFARRDENSQRGHFDAADAVTSACQLLQGKLRLDSIDLQVSLPQTKCRVAGSLTQFEQVVVNLVVNAHDAILEKRKRTEDWRGGDWVRVRVRDAIEKNGKVYITVSDTGTGISEHIKPRIFEPFLTSKASGKGTGLGLSISREIISTMRGTITPRNTRSGACFEIALPAYGEQREVNVKPKTKTAPRKRGAAKSKSPTA